MAAQNFQQMVDEATERQIAVFESVREQQGMTLAEFAPIAITSLQGSIRKMEAHYNGMPWAWRYREGDSTDKVLQQDAYDLAAYAVLRHYQELVN